MSDSFVHELPLKADPHIEKELDIRFDFGSQLYNAVLHEALNKISLIKQSKLWQKACKAKKGRASFFREALSFYAFTDYQLQKFAIASKNRCSMKEHLDTHVCQKLATRAYLAADQYLKKIRGRPRFKRKGWISSLEGKSNDAGIRFREGAVYWRGLKIPVVFDKKDQYKVEAHALSCKIKYCRIVRKNIKGKKRFFVQLILDGKPFVKEKNQPKDGTVGLDIGPSSIAVFSEKKAFLQGFCEELEPISKDIGKIQKNLDRSRRTLNPDNYQEDGCIKKGRLTWKLSKRYNRKKGRLSEGFRKLKEYRKRLQGKLANQICQMGSKIKIEKTSIRGWQKLYGKSIAKRAPSLFINILRRKVENTGGSLKEFSTVKTALSQICHLCGTRQKKSLSQRWHTCCNLNVQRDLYSSFLAFCVEDNKLDICQAKKLWPSAQLLLEQAISRLTKVASGKSRLASFGLQRQSSSLVKDRSVINKIEDVVGSFPRASKSLSSSC